MRLLVLLAAFLAVPACAADCQWPATLWDGPLTGARISADPQIRACVQTLLQTPGAKLVIRYGMGDEAAVEASELRFWLLALALDPARVDLREDAEVHGPLELSIQEGK